MKALGVGLIALPIVLFMLAGLIFDTVDFLTAMGAIALIAAPVVLGLYLIDKA